MFGVHLRPTKQFAHFVAADHLVVDRRTVTSRHATCDLARYRGQLTLELTHTAFARVFADDAHDRFVGERQLASAKARFFQLTRNEIRLGDRCLLAFGVAAEVHDFHAIQQWTRDVLNEV